MLLFCFLCSFFCDLLRMRLSGLWPLTPQTFSKSRREVKRDLGPSWYRGPWLEWHTNSLLRAYIKITPAQNRECVKGHQPHPVNIVRTCRIHYWEWGNFKDGYWNRKHQIGELSYPEIMRNAEPITPSSHASIQVGARTGESAEFCNLASKEARRERRGELWTANAPWKGRNSIFESSGQPSYSIGITVAESPKLVALPVRLCPISFKVFRLLKYSTWT